MGRLCCTCADTTVRGCGLGADWPTLMLLWYRECFRVPLQHSGMMIFNIVFSDLFLLFHNLLHDLFGF